MATDGIVRGPLQGGGTVILELGRGFELAADTRRGGDWLGRYRTAYSLLSSLYDFGLNLCPFLFFCEGQFILCLKIHPELCAIPKIAG